jgi:DNA-directed RNA polymerase specialized sigma24 family protein
MESRPTRDTNDREGSAEPFGSDAPLVSVESLVRGAQRGDAVALESLIRELAPYVGRICGAIALDDGDDALQESMVAIVRNIGTLREPAALRGWARRIAVRESIRITRARRPVPVDPGLLGAIVSVRDGSGDADIRAVLETMSPEQRAVLVMRDVDGLSEAEMAEVLGVATGTVKSRVHRARAAFRERWTS